MDLKRDIGLKMVMNFQVNLCGVLLYIIGVYIIITSKVYNLKRSASQWEGQTSVSGKISLNANKPSLGTVLKK